MLYLIIQDLKFKIKLDFAKVQNKTIQNKGN
jgi:hypothetical protein